MRAPKDNGVSGVLEGFSNGSLRRQLSIQHLGERCSVLIKYFRSRSNDGPYVRQTVACSLRRVARVQYEQINPSSLQEIAEIDSCNFEFFAKIVSQAQDTCYRLIFDGHEAIDRLLTPRYWQIREMTPSCPRPFPLIKDEVDTQARYLEGYVAQLRHEQDVFRPDSGELALMLDTNIYMHYQPPNQVDWRKYFQASSIRLILPLPVVDEIDNLTYSANVSVRHAAKAMSRELHEWRGRTHPEKVVPVPGRDGVGTQLLLDPPGHRRSPNVDDEVLNRSEHLTSILSDRLIVVTGDHGMFNRAIARGLSAWWPPSNLRRDAKATSPP